MPGPASRHVVVQRIDVAQATTEHDGRRVEHIDELGERAGQPFAVALEAGACARLALRVRGNDRRCVERATAVARVVG
jgi:hypothetical protein